jgi:hypothetical protein
MNRQKQLELIRAKCIEAKPTNDFLCGCACCEVEGQDFERPIRLADVLLAINSAIVVMDNPTSEDAENYSYRIMDTVMKWNWRKDDLTAQSDQCITFLANLLEV